MLKDGSLKVLFIKGIDEKLSIDNCTHSFLELVNYQLTFIHKNMEII